MPHDPQKRVLRKLKRDVKKAGSKHRRRGLKQQLRDNPASAHEAEEDVGGHSSAAIGPLDQDATRQKKDRRS